MHYWLRTYSKLGHMVNWLALLVITLLNYEKSVNMSTFWVVVTLLSLVAGSLTVVSLESYYDGRGWRHR